jgi:hypothetical protein
MDKYFNILITKHSKFINDITDTYFTKNYDEQIFTYFRIFFFYYLITSYIYKPELNISEIKKVFFLWIEHTLTNKLKKEIINNFNFHYNYLFKVFFVDKNMYFHVYFNNLIKYFLPLPYELNMYSPLITFRNNVTEFYKKNNIDYLEKTNSFDLNNKYPFSYRIHDIDIHIPISNFDNSIYKDMDVIYLVAKKDKLYIIDPNNNILYSRTNNVNSDYNKYLKDFLNKKSFEEMFPLWKKEIGNINFENSIYISVMKKITTRDLFNVFDKYNVTINKYKYLFHNALLTEDEIKNDIILNRETFFYLIPLTKSKYFSSEEKRNCIVFKINSDINNLLDLTSTIVSNNNFKKYLIQKDKKNKVWISYDPLKINEYYKSANIPTKFDENFKCLTIKKADLKDRKYCDVYEYAGRRKLQEILFKTRKYRFKKLYFEFKSNENLEKYSDYKIYHPPNIPINITWDFDKFLLKELDLNGFFSVDYGDAVSGGEILLTNPKKFISKIALSDKTCFSTDAFTENELVD